MKKHSVFHVKKRTLLAVAGCVWLIAGGNVARLGILSYGGLCTSERFIFCCLLR